MGGGGGGGVNFEGEIEKKTDLIKEGNKVWLKYSKEEGITNFSGRWE